MRPEKTQQPKPGRAPGFFVPEGCAMRWLLYTLHNTLARLWYWLGLMLQRTKRWDR